MKKISVLLLTALMVLGMCGCGAFMQSEPVFTEDDLVFTNGDEEFELQLNQSLYIWEDYSFVEEHADYSYEEFETEFTTARGLELGDSVEDYAAAYYNKSRYAIWELCTEDNYTEFVEYDGESASDIADSDVYKWLDCGYYLDGDEWKTLTAKEVQDIWFCDADLDDYDEVVIISVNLSESDEIDCISFNYFEYDEGFVSYQDWDE